MSKPIGVVVGSLRKESFNLKMAKVLMELAPESLQLEIIPIGSLPLYNEDLDNNPPKEWVTFRERIRECKGLLFVTPEYNRSVPGVLKNAIDVGSRPYGKSVWENKPGAVMSVSPSAIGGFGSNQHLRQTFVFLNILPMQQPECYIGHVDKLFNAEGKIENENTIKLLEKFLNTFNQWVEKINTPLS